MGKGTCTFTGGCPEPVHCKGLCAKHYGRLRKHGDPGRVDRPGVRPRPKAECSIIEDGRPCGKPVNSHGLCGKHDQRRRRYGDPLALKVVVIQDMEERFFSHVRKEPGPDGCWVWTAALFQDGYGEFGNGAGEVVGAHRWSYEHFVRPVPEGLETDHLCHTRERLTCVGGPTCPHRRCVNPAHLEAVPKDENGRRGVPTGMPDDLIADLHARYLAGEKVVSLALEARCTRESLYRRFRRLAS